MSNCAQNIKRREKSSSYIHLSPLLSQLSLNNFLHTCRNQLFCFEEETQRKRLQITKNALFCCSKTLILLPSLPTPRSGWTTTWPGTRASTPTSRTSASTPRCCGCQTSSCTTGKGRVPVEASRSGVSLFDLQWKHFILCFVEATEI